MEYYEIKSLMNSLKIKGNLHDKWNVFIQNNFFCCLLTKIKTVDFINNKLDFKNNSLFIREVCLVKILKISKSFNF